MAASHLPTHLLAEWAPALLPRAQGPWETDKQHGEAAGIPSGSRGPVLLSASPFFLPWGAATAVSKWNRFREVQSFALGHRAPSVAVRGGGGKNARVSEPKARLRHPGAWVMLTLPPSLTSTSTPVTDAREKLPAPHPAGSCHPASPSSIRAPARSALGPSWCPCCCLLHLPPEIPTFYCVSSSRMGAHPLNTNQGPTAAEHILRVPIFTRRRSRIQIPAYLSLRCEPRKLTLEIPCS